LNKESRNINTNIDIKDIIKAMKIDL